MTHQPRDIGEYLDVPEGEREDVDPAPEYNADAGFDVQVVPDGIYRELSTAADDEPVAYEDEEPEDNVGDGAPLQFLSPADPEATEGED